MSDSETSKKVLPGDPETLLKLSGTYLERAKSEEERGDLEACCISMLAGHALRRRAVEALAKKLEKKQHQFSSPFFMSKEKRHLRELEALCAEAEQRFTELAVSIRLHEAAPPKPPKPQTVPYQAVVLAKVDDYGDADVIGVAAVPVGFDHSTVRKETLDLPVLEAANLVRFDRPMTLLHTASEVHEWTRRTLREDGIEMPDDEEGLEHE